MNESCVPPETSPNYGPTFFQVLNCKPPEWVPLIGTGAGILVLMVLLAGRATGRFTELYWSHPDIVIKTRVVICYYPLYGFIHLVKIINPRGNEIYEFVGDVSESIMFVVFYRLVWSYAGGYNNVLPRVVGSEIQLAAPPLCCLRCKPCHKEVTRGLIRFYEWLIMQVPVVQVLLGLVEVHAFVNNVGSGELEGREEVRAARSTVLIIITVIQALSIMSAMYGIGVLYNIWNEYTHDKKIRLKFVLFKLTIVLNKVQSVIFSRVSSSVTPVGDMSGYYRATTWGGCLVLVECLLFTALATRLYQKSDITTRPDYVAPPRDLIRITNAMTSQLSETGGHDMSYDVTDLKFKEDEEDLIN